MTEPEGFGLSRQLIELLRRIPSGHRHMFVGWAEVLAYREQLAVNGA